LDCQEVAKEDVPAAQVMFHRLEPHYQVLRRDHQANSE
jgi:hypothetical protein